MSFIYLKYIFNKSQLIYQFLMFNIKDGNIKKYS